MIESLSERVRPGASVDWIDGHLGRVVRLEPGTSEEPGLIEVLVEGTQRTFFVPLDLVSELKDDGSVRLSAARADIDRLLEGESRTLELAEEELVARKELREAGQILIRKVVEEVPRRLEVDAYHEEVTVEHVPIGRVVTEREQAREEDGVFTVPIYEEQLVVVKRLVLKEEIRIRRRGATEKRLFDEMIRRERLVVEDVDQTGRVREHYASRLPEGEPVAGDEVGEERRAEGGGLLEKLGRRMLQ